MLKIVLTIFWFGLVPFGIGLGLTKNRKEDADSFRVNILLGYFAMLALFQTLCIPAMFLRVPFHVLCYLYGCAALVFFALSVFFNRRRLGRCTWGRVRQCGRIPLLMWAAILLIAVQIAVYLVGMATDLDDANYVALATTAIESDGIFTHTPYTGRPTLHFDKRYALSPFPLFLAFVSRATGFHPTVAAHTVMPVFFLLLAYSVYGLWGRKLFGADGSARGLFLCLVSLVHIFSYYSVYTQGTFMLIRIWQGKAFLAAVLLPALFYFGWQYLSGKNSGIPEWPGIFLLLMACCCASGMGIMLGPIMLGLLGITACVHCRNWRRLLPAILCCLPNIIYAALYLLMP